MTTYLIPTVTNGKKLVLEYRVVRRKKDMRTSFCKVNEKNIVDSWGLTKAILNNKMIVKDDRVIAPNGGSAFRFKKELEM